MGYLDDNGLARLWEKIKNKTHKPIVEITIPDGFCNRIVAVNTADNNLQIGINVIDTTANITIPELGEWTIVYFDNENPRYSNTIIIDAVKAYRINITQVNNNTYTTTDKKSANIGQFVNNNSQSIINTGLLNLSMLKLYYWDTDNNKPILAVECHPDLNEPFNQITYVNLPIDSVMFDGGVVTINWLTPTGLSCMWKAYV